MPHRRHEVEKLEVRATYWSLIIDILRLSHRYRFEGRFGPNILSVVTYGACLVVYARAKPIQVRTIAAYRDLPKETARRRLRHLVNVGLLEREGRSYRPAEKVRAVV